MAGSSSGSQRRRWRPPGRTPMTLAQCVRSPLLLLLLLVGLVLVGLAAAARATAASCPRRPAGFLPSVPGVPGLRVPSSSMRWRRVDVVVLGAGGPRQRPHQGAGMEKPRRGRAGTGANPLKALRRAVAMVNGLLQLLFATGDMFGQMSSSGGTPAPDLGRRRGGGSGGSGGNEGRPPPPAAAGGRWRRLRRRPEGEEGEAEEGTVPADDGEYVVSKQDLNSWDTWYGGGWGRRSGAGLEDEAPEQQRGGPAQQQQQQRRRKKVTFSTRYSCAVPVANATRLGDYMTLPFDQYSLLDQTFISRIEGREDAFRFTVPANELVGLQTVPIVDVQVSVDARRRVLTIASIASRLVSRAADGTVLSTHQVGLLANNSLKFSTKISWADPGTPLPPGGGDGGLLGGRGNWTVGGSADEGAGYQQQPQPNGPGANLMRLRRRIFQGGIGGSSDDAPSGAAAATDDLPLPAATATPTDQAPAAGPDAAEPESFQDSTRRKLSGATRRRLTCQARVEVGVVVPPPFSLLPGLVLRQGASLILSTLVSTLATRFLDLLIEDFYRWAQDDEASRLAASASGGGLLGWDPMERRPAGAEGAGDDEEPPLPPPEYII